MTRIWLLPGMDGTGKLHKDLISELEGHDVRAVSYEGGTYEEAYASLPAALKRPDADDVIAAESFGGPLGICIAATPSRSWWCWRASWRCPSGCRRGRSSRPLTHSLP
jgi:hypothetical protein